MTMNHLGFASRDLGQAIEATRQPFVLHHVSYDVDDIH
jgi:hypothetical protein